MKYGLPTILLLTYAQCGHATTEWFGDLRAHLNPSNSPAFYDIIYSDDNCPQGIESNAIPEYVYFGSMLSTKTVDNHADCLQQCVLNEKCKAINYFEPLRKSKHGYCELLNETQWDNPRLMRPFHKATYYEMIRCRDEDQLDSIDIIKFDPPTTTTPKPTDAATKPTTEMFAKKKPQVSDNIKLLKKLSDKIREFNLRFRARI